MKVLVGYLLIVFGVLLIAFGVSVLALMAGLARVLWWRQPVSDAPTSGRRTRRKRTEPEDLPTHVVTVRPEDLPVQDREAWELGRRALEGE